MDTLSIAATGLSVAAVKLEVSAHNLANAGTRGFAPASAAVRSAPQGGAEASVQLGDPERDAQVDRALLAPSRTDVSAEVVQQAAGTALYRANLASLRTAQETDKALFDIVR